jgi:hypothetical protein
MRPRLPAVVSKTVKPEVAITVFELLMISGVARNMLKIFEALE